MRIHFKVVCDKCGQTLDTADGQAYQHGNPDDCDAGGVTLPECTVEQLSALLKPAPVVKSPKTASKKAASTTKKGKK